MKSKEEIIKLSAINLGLLDKYTLSREDNHIYYRKEIVLDAMEEYANQFKQNDWKRVYDETPPTQAELLVKSPDGHVNIASWRESYSIFSCQNKHESSDSWMWKLID